MSFWSGLKGLGRNRHYNRGIVHYNRGEYEAAATAFEQALGSIGDPNDPDYSLGAFYAAEARANLALACLRSGDVVAAENHLRRAIEANPDYPDLRYYLASVLERTNRLDEARAECGEALAQNPQYLRARLLLCVCADRLGDSEGAGDALRIAREQGYHPPSTLKEEPWEVMSEEIRDLLRHFGEERSRAHYHFDQGLDHYAQGRMEEALAAFALAIQSEPRFPDLRAKRASLLAELKRHDEAVEEWEKALEINPEYLEARIRLGLSLLELGRAKQASNEILKGLEQAPENPDLLYMAGAALFCDGRREEARIHLEKASGRGANGDEAARLLMLCGKARQSPEEEAKNQRQIREAVTRGYRG